MINTESSASESTCPDPLARLLKDAAARSRYWTAERDEFIRRAVAAGVSKRVVARDRRARAKLLSGASSPGSRHEPDSAPAENRLFR